MNWIHLRHLTWLDTRARFVAGTPAGGSLLDLGSAEGETLGHIAELRPDLRLFAVDLAGQPEAYPPGCQFHRGDLEKEPLPWKDQSIDAITCMHLVEHLKSITNLIKEAARLLKPGGRIYFETPQAWTVNLPSPTGAAAGTFTLNFYDDPGHVRPVAIEDVARAVEEAGLEVRSSGTSRNWLFAAAYPLFLFRAPSRKKFTAQAHWLGWSACLEAFRPLRGQEALPHAGPRVGDVDQKR